MLRQTIQPITASESIDEALRRDLAGNGNTLPIATLISQEHGPLVVMRAVDIAAVMSYLRPPLTRTPSTS